MDSSLTHEEVFASLLAGWSVLYPADDPPDALETVAVAMWRVLQYRLDLADPPPDGMPGQR